MKNIILKELEMRIPLIAIEQLNKEWTKRQLELLQLEIKLDKLNEIDTLFLLEKLGWDTSNETLESWLEFQMYEPSEIPTIQEFVIEGNLGTVWIKRNEEKFDVEYIGGNDEWNNV